MPTGALHDASGTITTGDTAQTVVAANKERQYLIFQNVSDAAMWVDFQGAVAVKDSPSLQIAAGGVLTYEGGFVPNGAVSVICATTGKKFTCKWG